MAPKSFRHETKRLIPVLPKTPQQREFLKGAFGRLKELLGRYCGESRVTRAHTPPTCSIRHEKGAVLSVVRNGTIRDPLVAWAPNQQGAWWLGSLLGLAPDTFPPVREPSVADDKRLSVS